MVRVSREMLGGSRAMLGGSREMGRGISRDARSIARDPRCIARDTPRHLARCSEDLARCLWVLNEIDGESPDLPRASREMPGTIDRDRRTKKRTGTSACPPRIDAKWLLRGFDDDADVLRAAGAGQVEERHRRLVVDVGRA